MPEPTWNPDLTMVCERLAQHLRDRGVANPVAAAVARTARGHLGLDRTAFAHHLGIDPALVDGAEEGEVAFGDLPDEIAIVVDDDVGGTLLRLADLHRRFGS